jgi:hypothetical protein
MKHDDAHVQTSGTVTDIFGHRFVLETKEGKVLADIGPKTADKVSLKTGMKVDIEGERKPSEIKVARISIGEAEPISTQHDDKHFDTEWTADRAKALAEAEGYSIIGEMKAKKKHFEAKANKGSHKLDIHIHRDGVREH